MFDTEPFMKWTQTSISLTNYQMGQLDCGAKTNVCQAKTYQNHGEQRSLTRAYYYHITFVARLSSRKAFINRRLGCGGAVVRALASHQWGPGSNPGVDAVCELSLWLVLCLPPRSFSPGTSVFPFQITIPSGTHGYVSASSFKTKKKRKVLLKIAIPMRENNNDTPYSIACSL